jgi:hypothetical protein
LVLTGKNDPSIATIQVTGVPAAVVQSTSTIWRAELRLASGKNRVEINGLDVAGNTSESLILVIELPGLTQEQHRVFNVFDEHGLFLALPRLPGEKNQQYRNRLLDVNVHPSDTTLRGVSFGASREIGLRLENAILVSSPLDAKVNDTRAVNGTLKIGQVYLDLESERFRTRERLVIEPATQRISLTRFPRSVSEITISTLEGDVIPETDWEYDKRQNQIKFLTHTLNSLPVYVSFPYKERIDLRGKSFATLRTAIEAFVDPDGDPLFEVTVLADPSLPASDLIPLPKPVLIQSIPAAFERSSLRVKELLNDDFQQSLLNARGHAIGTKLEAWANQINNQTRIVWRSTFLGESVWQPLGDEPKLGALPHLLDPERGHWECQDASDSTRYTLKDFRENAGTCPIDGSPLKYRGIHPLEFQSGTGTRDDLKVRDITVVRGE